jgi:hypothetical protein
MRPWKTGLAVMLLLLTVLFAAAEELKSATVTGRVATKSGAPMAEAYVYLFNETLGPPPLMDRYWRLPDEIVMSDMEGRFTTQVPYGTYYIGAIKRINGRDVGPPVAGDILLASSTDEILQRKFLFNKERIDIGVIDQGVPYSPLATPRREGITAIEGKVVNADGKPAIGVSVFAFTSPNMIGRPLFASDLTGADGTFTLSVASGGSYFLRAREGYGGGPPKLGGLIGMYGDHDATPITVVQGQTVKGIRMIVAPFAGKGVSQSTAKPQSGPGKATPSAPATLKGQ